jgi:hypothetical protein
MPLSIEMVWNGRKALSRGHQDPSAPAKQQARYEDRFRRERVLIFEPCATAHRLPEAAVRLGYPNGADRLQWTAVGPHPRMNAGLAACGGPPRHWDHPSTASRCNSRRCQSKTGHASRVPHAKTLENSKTEASIQKQMLSFRHGGWNFVHCKRFEQSPGGYHLSRLAGSNSASSIKRSGPIGAPQTPCSHRTKVPVRASSWPRKSTSLDAALVTHAVGGDRRRRSQ